MPAPSPARVGEVAPDPVARKENKNKYIANIIPGEIAREDDLCFSVGIATVWPEWAFATRTLISLTTTLLKNIALHCDDLAVEPQLVVLG